MDAVYLVDRAQQLLRRCVSTLWIDCQQVQVLDRCGQAAILQIERLAAQARIVVYWQGFSESVVQQLSETGLYLLLRHSPMARREKYFD
ncbi:STAS domain-containing protein [Hymenobacter sediminis]|uniref:STAS domain-containing protein n=1 Tax=Hymenobacter sediminis TaxID=2218621 RepID=UPI000DA68987|nr:STAS domain-containing protein [Hymenobacter sediminis]RPD44164.1 STAS domain-containing protein [Hymenobacter sediminis]